MDTEVRDVRLQPQEIQKEPGMWDAFSMVPVIAAAAATGTSVLLMNQIGVVGGVIGAVAGAATTAFANQVYQAFLHSANRKIRSKATSTQPVELQNETLVNAEHLRDYEERDARSAKRNKLIAAAIVVAIAVAAAGVAALVISMATNGQGIGEKPKIILVEESRPIQNTEAVVDETEDNATAGPVESVEKPPVVEESRNPAQTEGLAESEVPAEPETPAEEGGLVTESAPSETQQSSEPEGEGAQLAS